VAVHFSAEDVELLLDLDELMHEMRTALYELSAGRVVMPLRSIVQVKEDSWFALMPAVYRDVFGAKLVTVFPENAGTPIHTHQALIQLFDAATGEPLATLDGRVITAWRTAAVSALATDVLAREDAKVLAILGSGVQARTHLAMLNKVRDFHEVRVWSRTPEHADAFAEETGATAMELEQAVRGADVVCTVTNSNEAFLKGGWLKDFVHVNAIGSVGMHKRELDNQAMSGAAIVVESRAAALSESAEIVQSGSVIYAELGELFAGLKPRPKSPKTIYKSLGVAAEDIAAARLLYCKAQKTRHH
jgi:thiomorpholine-carboxylate dehydrogenase